MTKTHIVSLIKTLYIFFGKKCLNFRSHLCQIVGCLGKFLLILQTIVFYKFEKGGTGKQLLKITIFLLNHLNIEKYRNTRSLGALRAPTSRLRPFGPALDPSGLLDNVLHALRALRPCDPRNSAMMG